MLCALIFCVHQPYQFENMVRLLRFKNDSLGSKGQFWGKGQLCWKMTAVAWLSVIAKRLHAFQGDQMLLG